MFGKTRQAQDYTSWPGACDLAVLLLLLLLCAGSLLSCIVSCVLGMRLSFTVLDAQGEAFDFATPVVIDGAVEVWMSAVEKEMRTTSHRSAAKTPNVNGYLSGQQA